MKVRPQVWAALGVVWTGAIILLVCMVLSLAGCSALSVMPANGGWEVHGWLWPLVAVVVLVAIVRGGKS